MMEPSKLQLDLTSVGLTPASFLAEYWQKKPLLIRQGVRFFQDLLSPDELAGLACEEFVESRLISHKDKKWSAVSGPIESYDHLGEKDWTLVVQALDHWVAEAESLIRCFDFLPRWRFDDVMASFAAVGGSVGPHVDLYDVFICQGSGRRHWRVGKQGDYQQYAAHEALLHVDDFEPIIDVQLECGDLLYIPPRCPHQGVALENSMSFSVGFRTDAAVDVFSGLADYLADKGLANDQIEDPGRPLSHQPGQISALDLGRVKQQLLGVFSDELLTDFAGSYLSKTKCELDLPAEPWDYTLEEVLNGVRQQSLTKLGGLRCFYFESALPTHTLYIQGEKLQLPPGSELLIPILCDQSSLSWSELAPFLDNESLINCLVALVNLGYWYFENQPV